MLKVSVSPLGSVAVGWKLYAAPALTVAAGVPLIVGAVLLGAFTRIANAGNEAVRRPSLTVMMMFENVPAAVGVPLKRPVAVSNAVAQLGRFWIEKPSVPPSGSVALGVNEYAEPAFTDVAGVPVMVGARLAGAVTLIINAGNDAVARPSLARMVMFEYVPTSVVAGVPLKRPLAVLKVAQRGRFVIE